MFGKWLFVCCLVVWVIAEAPGGLISTFAIEVWEQPSGIFVPGSAGRAETPRWAAFYCLLLDFRTHRVEVLITEIGFHLLLWKDLISDKMSAGGLSGGLKLLGDDHPSRDK